MLEPCPALDRASPAVWHAIVTVMPSLKSSGYKRVALVRGAIRCCTPQDPPSSHVPTTTPVGIGDAATVGATITGDGRVTVTVDVGTAALLMVRLGGDCGSGTATVTVACWAVADVELFRLDTIMNPPMRARVPTTTAANTAQTVRRVRVDSGVDATTSGVGTDGGATSRAIVTPGNRAAMVGAAASTPRRIANAFAKSVHVAKRSFGSLASAAANTGSNAARSGRTADNGGGDEPEGSHTAAELPVAFTEAGLDEVAALTVIEDINPDGRAAGTRGNANGIDVNRNFPASNFDATITESGGEPLSQPESRALVETIDRVRPSLILVAHSWRGRQFINFDGPAREIAEQFSATSGLPVEESSAFAPTPGSLGSYAGRDRGMPLLTIEVLRGTDPNVVWTSLKTALLDAIHG